MKEIDKVFKALADPSRRELLDRLHAKNGQTLSELCKGLDMARQSVTQHLGLLEDANLISVQRQGRKSCTTSTRFQSTRSTSAGFGNLNRSASTLCTTSKPNFERK